MVIFYAMTATPMAGMRHAEPAARAAFSASSSFAVAHTHTRVWEMSSAIANHLAYCACLMLGDDRTLRACLLLLQFAMKRVAVGIWGCKACHKVQAGGAYTMK